jgi:hypothetical protein
VVNALYRHPCGRVAGLSLSILRGIGISKIE